MSASQHTPGPWTTQINTGGKRINHLVGRPRLENEVLGRVIVDIIDRTEIGAANARLIAAAPELLDALKRIME